jgi:hypothetical protein
MSQKKRLLQHLKTKSITRLEGWDVLGIIELPARVSELKAEGYPVCTTMKKVFNRYGEAVHIAVYSLEEPF